MTDIRVQLSATEALARFREQAEIVDQPPSVLDQTATGLPGERSIPGYSGVAELIARFRDLASAVIEAKGEADSQVIALLHKKAEELRVPQREAERLIADAAQRLARPLSGDLSADRRSMAGMHGAASRGAPPAIQGLPPSMAIVPVVDRWRPGTGSCVGDLVINPRDGARLVWAPAGELLMGSDTTEISAILREFAAWYPEWFAAETPQRRVFVDGYWIYQSPVTVAQYRRFCSDSLRDMPKCPTWGWIDDHPVVNVSWRDARAYADWAGVMLPTEAEWERAARGSDDRRYPWGHRWDPSRCHCLVSDPGGTSSTAPVGSYPTGTSPFGCLDMSGNVWEWCSDWYSGGYYHTAPYRNPSGPPVGKHRSLRGGSWQSDNPVNFRCSDRLWSIPDLGFDYNGFRCVAR